MKLRDDAPREGQSASAPPRKRASLAGRISTWTTRLILTGIILVVGLGLGRQIREWWAADDMLPSPTPGGTTADDAGVQQITFGGLSWVAERRELNGTPAEAAAALVARCQKTVETGRLPVRPPDKAELALLKRLDEAKADGPSGPLWQVRVTDKPVPMVVGIRWGDAEQSPNSSAPQADLPAPNLARDTARVVIWGMAVPTGDRAWALYTFQPEQQPQTPGDGPVVPLPPDARPTLAIRTAGGGAMIGFEGGSSPVACQAFYEKWFAEHDWLPVGAWRSDADSWYARYRKADGPRQTVDIRVGRDRAGRVSGMIVAGE